MGCVNVNFFLIFPTGVQDVTFQEKLSKRYMALSVICLTSTWEPIIILKFGKHFFKGTGPTSSDQLISDTTLTKMHIL